MKNSLGYTCTAWSPKGRGTAAGQKCGEVRFFDAKTNKEIGERRTMTAEERKRNSDIEDKKGGVVGGKSGKALRLANPVLTPGEAMAAARADGSKASRKAKNPAYQAAVDASDAQDPTPVTGEA